MAELMAEQTDLVTYLTDSAEPQPGAEPPRVGDPVEFRLLGEGREIEAWSPPGRRLGRLPPTEREALAPFFEQGGRLLVGHIAALIPRPRHAGTGRIHVRVVAC